MMELYSRTDHRGNIQMLNKGSFTITISHGHALPQPQTNPMMRGYTSIDTKITEANFPMSTDLAGSFDLIIIDSGEISMMQPIQPQLEKLGLVGANVTELAEFGTRHHFQLENESILLALGSPWTDPMSTNVDPNVPFLLYRSHPYKKELGLITSHHDHLRWLYFKKMGFVAKRRQVVPE